MSRQPGLLAWSPLAAPTTTRSVSAKVQSVLGDRTALLVETGDTWFNGL